MNRLAFRGLRERKARTLFTLVAVVLGVALIAGTFVLTDTISKSFDRLVATAGENVDVKILSRNIGDGFGAAPAPFPASVEARVLAVDGVAAADGSFRRLSVTVANARGDRVGPISGAPTLAYSAVQPRFDPFEYEGRPPRIDREIALSATAAKDAGLEIGDRIRVQGTQRIRSYRMVGTTTFGGAGSTGGAAFTVLTLAEVQALAGEPGKITDLDVQAQPGVTQIQLKTRIKAQLGSAVLVRTGAEDSRRQSQDLSQILSYLTLGLLVGPLAALIGRPLAATGGVAARIARGNAARSPGRTAGTAAALMVGVALVAFVAIFVNGFKASFSGAFEEAVTAQFVVFDASGLTPEAVAPAAAKLPGVAAAANIRVGQGKLPSGADVGLDGLDPTRAPKVLKLDWVSGSDDTLRALGPEDALLEVDWAKEHSLHVGSSFELRNTEREPVRLTVRGTYENRGQIFRDVVVQDATLRERFGARTVLAAFIASAPGVSEQELRAQLKGLLDRDFPTLEPQTREEFITAQVGQVSQILYVFYALLGLSVIIALFGIVNTLALSVYERTRELGLLRAVGASRRQIRQIVRGEAIITAVMGAVLGVAVGVLFGVLVSRPLGSQGFVLAVPYTTLLILLVLGALAGTLAAIAPARRASHVDVLQALTHG